MTAEEIAGHKREADPIDVAAWTARVNALDALRRFIELCDDDCAIDWEVFEFCEDAGFAVMRKVTKADLDYPFADERGIEKGGIIFELTPLGLTIAQAIKNKK